jgi:hypothetical protein
MNFCSPHKLTYHPGTDACTSKKEQHKIDPRGFKKNKGVDN